MSAKRRVERKLNRLIGRKSLSLLMNQYIEMIPGVGLDLSFQSRARWNFLDKCEFISSCCSDMNISKFVLVDVASCLAAAKVAGDTESIKYYEGWLNRKVPVVYLNIDSNNRTTTIDEFLKGTKDKDGKFLVRIPHEDYEINEDMAPISINETNDTYETMPEILRDKFNTFLVSFCIVTKATRQQLSVVFKRMNSGESLNEYEKINCEFSDTCVGIRDLAEKLHPKFLDSPFFTLRQINRRNIDHWIATACFRFFNGIEIPFSKANKLNMYEKGSAVDKSIGIFKTAFTSYVNKMGKPDRFISRNLFLDLFYMMQDQLELNKRLKDDKEMKDDFISVIAKLASDSTPKYKYKVSKVKVRFADLYKGESKEQHELRRKAFADGGFDITKYFTKVLDSERSGDRMDKLITAERDGYKLNDGTPFEPDELFDGEFDLGHIVAHGNEGKSEIDNFVIEDKSKNRGKGLETTKIAETANA